MVEIGALGATRRCIVHSHRLELMRQIYNMNESACGEDEELTPAPALVLAPPPAVAAQQQQDILQCISACAQQTRLSLANLLPSRFVEQSSLGLGEKQISVYNRGLE